MDDNIEGPVRPEDPRPSSDLYESYVASLYQSQGWHVQSTGHTNAPDFGADLLAWAPDLPDTDPALVIQCKYWISPVGVEAVQAIYSAKDFYSAGQAVLVSNQPLTARAQQLADALHVTVRRIHSRSWTEGIPVDTLPIVVTPAVEEAVEASSTVEEETAAAVDAFAAESPVESFPQDDSGRQTPQKGTKWLTVIVVMAVLLGVVLLTTLTHTNGSVNSGTTAGSFGQNQTSSGPAAPSAPSNLQFVDGSSSVQLTWSPVSGATSYAVWREQDGKSAIIATVTATSYVDTSVSSGSSYKYWVAAHNAGGWSPYSQSISVTTFVPWQQIHSMYANSVVKITSCADLLCLQTYGGTGWFAPGGFIVTNYHVIKSATYYIDVTLQNDGDGSAYSGQTYHAHIVTTDAADDLALLQLDNGWSGTPVMLGNSSSLTVGEPVATLGHPGLEQLTMTTGKIEALHQDEEIQDYGKVPNMIVYNAGVVGGSSGSPVFDHWGKVIGIEEAAGTNNGNFDLAVPVNALRTLLEQNGVNLQQ